MPQRAAPSSSATNGVDKGVEARLSETLTGSLTNMHVAESGGVDPRPFQQHWQLSEVFGSPSETKSYWDSRAIINNSHRLLSSALDITLDCGVDDFFIETNRALRQKLLELNIAHDYSERPGGHNWNYWRRAIKYQMLFFSDGFDHKLKR